MKYASKIILLSIFMGIIALGGEVYPGQDDTARIFSVTGDVRVIPSGRNVGVECREGMVVRAGDWIRTGAGAFVTLAFDADADNVIRVQEDSLVILRLDGYFKVQLLKGKVNAILESVQHGETFRVLTPSVVTESASSSWMVSSEGDYSTVVVVEGEAFVVGISRDGSIKTERYGVPEGYSRRTKIHEEPGELSAVPENIIDWFQEQVVEHHLARIAAERTSEQASSSGDKREKPKDMKADGEKPGTPRPTRGSNIAIIDGEEVDILEYIYKRRIGLSE